MSISFWLDRSPENSKRSYDVIIVGAGISGLSNAYWLRKEDPSLKIAILEKSRVGFGASGRNAGFVTCGSVEHFNRMVGKHGLEQACKIWRFSEENLTLLKEHIVQDDSELLSFEQKGAYSLAAQDVEFEELKSVAKIMNDLSIPAEIIEGADIKEKVGASGFVGGIKYVDDASVNPTALLRKMAELTDDIDLFESTEVFSIEDGDGGTQQLRTDQGTFECSIVMLNTNGYSSNLHPWFRDKIYPTRGQCLMMEPVPRFMDAPCYANFYLDYFRQLPSGELLIGGFRQIEKDTEIGFSDNVTDVIQNALHSFVQDHLPQFKDVKVTHRWSGIMGFSSDGEPMVGSLPGQPQVFFAGGYTAHGIGLAFHTAKTLVDLVFERPVPDWISARRFG